MGGVACGCSGGGCNRQGAAGDEIRVPQAVALEQRMGEFPLSDNVDDKSTCEGDTLEALHSCRGVNDIDSWREADDELREAGRDGEERCDAGVEAAHLSARIYAGTGAGAVAPMGLNALAASIVRAVATPKGREGGGSVLELTEMQVDRLVDELEYAVDWQYDSHLGELMLTSMKEQLPFGELLRVLRRAPVVPRLLSRFHYVELVAGAFRGSASPGWFNVYRVDELQSIDVCIDKNDSSSLQYKARMVIPAPLTSAMVIANEVDMMPEWNNLVAGQPEVVGRRTAHYMCLNYQLSMLGLYKIDFLNEIRRYSDTAAGLCVEHVSSINAKSHPCYREPKKGFRRPITEVKNLWVACGPDTTMLIQMGHLKLPITATRWLASSVGSVAGRFLVSGLVNQSSKALGHGNAWQKRMDADVGGLYARLRELMNSECSRARAPAEKGKAPAIADGDLEQLFARRRQWRETVKETLAEAGDGAPGAEAAAGCTTTNTRASKVSTSADAQARYSVADMNAYGARRGLLAH